MIRTVVVCISLLFLWQLMVMVWDLPNYILPSPWKVFVTLKNQWHLIALQSLPTVIEIMLGFLLGIILGCLAGIMIALFRPLTYWFYPILIISQAIPLFA